MGSWYYHDYEYNFVEALVLIVLVIEALTFEQLWHKVAHTANHSYRYGRLHDKADRSQPDLSRSHTDHSHNHHLHNTGGYIKRTRLYKELVHRAGGEFMTLGVLAFTVFMFNNLGGFEALENVHKSYTDFSLPKKKDDWLHLVEVVHMKLFVGMILYFYLISSVVRSGVAKIHLWERCRLRRVKDLAFGAGALHLQQMDVELSEYLNMRSYFIDKVVQWKERRPDRYQELMTVVFGEAEADQDMLRKELDAKFSLASYLAVNVAEGILDTIRVHNATWCCLLGLFAILSLFHRYAKISIFDFLWVFIGLAFIVMLVMRYYVARIHRKIFKHYKKDDQAEASTTEASDDHQEFGREESTTKNGRRRKCHERFKTEIWFLRFLQMVLFINSYVFARILMDFHDWEESPLETLLSLALFSLIFISLTYFLYAWLPTFLALMALPPFLDGGNIHVFFRVLAEGPLLEPDQAELSTVAESADVAALSSKVDELCERMARLDAARGASATQPDETALDAVWAHLSKLEQKVEDVLASDKVSL